MLTATITTMMTYKPWIDEALRDVPPLSTTLEAMSLLRTSRRNLYRMVARGKIRALRPERSGSSRLLFAKAELARFLRTLETP
ncbi:MAG: helix-turn-helix domain-containing protein [Polyangiaceae bacterium]|nr:helix-turn-helix domain-containing protein [Polyangiaceae bacterium]